MLNGVFAAKDVGGWFDAVLSCKFIGWSIGVCADDVADSVVGVLKRS